MDDVEELEAEQEPLNYVLRKLPLFDNMYLNMQAINIGLTDFHLQDMEAELLRTYIDRERTPFLETMTVSAWSQMWVFAFYELLRTWRQKVRELLDYHGRLEAASDRETVIANQRRKIADASVISRDGGIFVRDGYDRMENDPAAAARLVAARNLVDPFFRRLEAIRVTLAKHEIPKTKGKYATAPGYGRIDMSDGSIYWMIDDKDGFSEILSRRTLAEQFRALSLSLDIVRED